VRISSKRFWSFCFLSLSATTLISCTGELIENKFKTYNEALQSGDVGRGWIPKFIPKSATNIIEYHDLDTNAMRIEFSFSEQDSSNLIRDFKLVDTIEISKIKDSMRKPPWSTINPNVSLDFYSGRDQLGIRSFLVVDWNTHRAQYWNYE